MARYYVNKNAQPNGDHEVHRAGCPHPPNPENEIFLAYYDTCRPAVAAARKHFRQVNGCYHCSRPCHTG